MVELFYRRLPSFKIVRDSVNEAVILYVVFWELISHEIILEVSSYCMLCCSIDYT